MGSSRQRENPQICKIVHAFRSIARHAMAASRAAATARAAKAP
jgi:hypothetical protein